MEDYQLSYPRMVCFEGSGPLLFHLEEAAQGSVWIGGESRIRTCEGVSQQIYSLPPLAAWVSPQIRKHGANGRIRTPDLLITNQLLYQLSYIGLYNDKKNGLCPFLNQ